MRKFIIYTAIILATIGCKKSIDSTNLNILPMPQSMELVNTHFNIDDRTCLEINAGEEDARILAEYLATSKLNLTVGEKSKRVELTVDENLVGVSSPEGYIINIDKTFSSETVVTV